MIPKTEIDLRMSPPKFARGNSGNGYNGVKEKGHVVAGSFSTADFR